MDIVDLVIAGFFSMFPLFFIAAGLFLIRISLRTFLKLRGTKNWIVCHAKVISKQIKNETNVSNSEIGVSGRKRKYIPEIIYDYDYQGKSYRNDQLKMIREAYSSKEKAEEQISSYTEKSEVMVFVNPDNPEEAVLNKNFPETLKLFLGIGIFLLLTGFWIFSVWYQIFGSEIVEDIVRELF